MHTGRVANCDQTTTGAVPLQSGAEIAPVKEDSPVLLQAELGQAAIKKRLAFVAEIAMQVWYNISDACKMMRRTFLVCAGVALMWCVGLCWRAVLPPARRTRSHRGDRSGREGMPRPRESGKGHPDGSGAGATSAGCEGRAPLELAGAAHRVDQDQRVLALPQVAGRSPCRTAPLADEVQHVVLDLERDAEQRGEAWQTRDRQRPGAPAAIAPMRTGVMKEYQVVFL